MLRDLVEAARAIAAELVYEAMRRDPTPAPILQEAKTFATFEPGAYEVVDVFTGA
jgi:hypothetical protein